MKNKNVLNSFASLRKQNQNIQIKSGTDVLNHLWIKQKESGVEEPCNELILGLKRIIRGLGAPRSDSRRGFYLTFVGLCELFGPSTVTIQMCLDAIKSELSEFSSKSEENDLHKGQLLVYGGLIHSGKILQASREEIKELLKQLIIIGGKKSYLMLAAHTFLIEFLTKIDENTFKKSVWYIIRDELLKGNKQKTLQWYNLLCFVREKFPHVINDKFLNDLNGCSKIFHENNLESIAKLMLAVQSPVDSQPIYKHLIRNIVNDKQIFKKFWLIVDEYLSSTASVMIVFIFKLFIRCIEELDDKTSIKNMLTPNFVKLLESKNEISSSEEARLDIISRFSKIVSEKDILNSNTQEAIVQKLLFSPGSLDFLQGPGLMLFNNLANNFNEATVKSIVKCFSDILVGASENIFEDTNVGVVKKPWKDFQKRKACSVLIKLLGHRAVISCIDWKVEQIKMFIDIAFFSKSISPTLVEDAKKGLYSSLDFKFANLTDMCLFLNGLVLYFKSKIKEANASFELSKEAKKAWKKMLKTVAAIENVTSSTDNEKLTNIVFRVLFMLLGLTIFSDTNAAIENLSELHAIYKRMCCESKTSESNDDDNPQDLRWTDVVIDLLLSLLSNDQHFVRNIISKIFIFLCPHLSAENIHQILDVLDPNVDNILASNVNKSNEENDNTAEDKDNDGAETEDDSDSNDDNSSVESELEEDIAEEADLDLLHTTLREALGDAGAVTDTESVDLDDLDEEEGKRLNESLSEAFKHLKERKVKVRDAERKQLSDFRTRVLDLLEKWLKTSPELNLLFDVLVTALMLLEHSLQNQMDLELQTKLKAFLKQVMSVKDFSTNNKLHAKQLVDLMKKLLNKDDKSHSVYVTMTPQIVDCCTFILKLSLRDIKPMKKLRPLILEVYQNALNIFFNKNNSIVPVELFKSAFALPWDGSLELISDVVNFSLKPDVRLFYLTHGFQLLQIFLRNKRLLNPDDGAKYSEKIRHIAQKLADNIDVVNDKPGRFRSQYIELCQTIKKLDVASDIIGSINIDSLRKGSGKRKLENESTTPKTEKKQKKTKNTGIVEDVNIEATNEENVKKKRKSKGPDNVEDVNIEATNEENVKKKRKSKAPDDVEDVNVEATNEEKVKAKRKSKTPDDDEDMNTEATNEGKVKKRRKSNTADDIDDKDNSITNKSNESAVKKNSKRKSKNQINKHRNELKMKRKRKLARFEEFSKGLEDGVFGSHLYNNSHYIEGEIQNDESEND